MAEEDGDITFEQQIALEQEERKRQDNVETGTTKVDPDGTAYDWDEKKKAWFPRVTEDFIARYQMSYASEIQSPVSGGGPDKVKESSETPSEKSPVDFTAIPPPPDVDDPGYGDWYYKYGVITNSQEYIDWYNYYYGQEGQNADASSKTEDDTSEVVKPSPAAGTSNPHDESYWERLKVDAERDAEAGIEAPTTEDIEKSIEEADPKKAKKKKERPPDKPASWFNMEEEDNTNVYISGLPPSINADSFQELASKCGLIALDPLTRKPKLKLYKDGTGNPKGDGLCCYIKPESVDLALNILDGYVLDGHTLSVEKAKFELKGNYDPTKRKRKLTNKEKQKFREKQAKLFEWRPDKPRFARSRHEKTVIVKNVFSLHDVDQNLLLVGELEEDLQTECTKYGQVKKVKVYERNPEGVVRITFTEAEEADVCKEALNGRWFACRQLTAETWDGKTKYYIEESEDEYKKRLVKWEQYLEGKSGESAQEKPVRNVPIEEENQEAPSAAPDEAESGENESNVQTDMECGSIDDNDLQCENQSEN